MPLKPPETVRKALTNPTIYNVWGFYKTNIQAPDIARGSSAHRKVQQAFQKIKNINAYHPAWMTNWIDFDQDMYHACYQQSTIVYSTYLLYKKGKTTETLAALNFALDDLKILSTLASQTNKDNAASRVLFIVSLVYSLLAKSIPAIIALLSPAITLPLLITLFIDYVLFVCAPIMLYSIYLNIKNPSPQGSIKLAKAMDELFDACSDLEGAPCSSVSMDR